ncbi:hypothetical protein AL547_023630 [Vibrio vulnificus]|uniref:hypothetical protein n=1 Tax=Vibrio vulnificus TaxID=672 RepID=UPI00073559A9|nr:hypothetical protein [Vibrio vulnificus]PNM97149.1 hypothetical protein AL547_023630 [Vibrio vulnificus]
MTYEITSGNDNNYFAIDSDGKVTLTDAACGDQQRCGRGPNQPDAGVTASDARIRLQKAK